MSNNDQLFWKLQEQLFDARPKDYPGDQVSWEMNVIYWIIRMKEAYEKNEISLEIVLFVTDKILKGERAM